MLQNASPGPTVLSSTWGPGGLPHLRGVHSKATRKTLHWEAVLSAETSAKCQQEPHEFRDERTLEMWRVPNLTCPHLSFSLLWKSPPYFSLQNPPARTSRPLCWGYNQGSMLSFTGQPCAAELVMLFGTEVQWDHLVAKSNSHFPLLTWAHIWNSRPNSLIVTTTRLNSN